MQKFQSYLKLTAMIHIPDNLIERKVYIDKIKPFIEQPLIKALVGQRRVGKSYILFSIMKYIMESRPGANIIYINFEDFKFSDIATAEALHRYISDRLHNEERNYIFIDEIQEIPGFEKVIRSFLLDPSNDIYITGSNSSLLSGELASHLSGRHIEINVYSLSYSEFMIFRRLPDCDETLRLYARYGGLPYLTNLALDDATAGEYLKSVFTTIVYRDVVVRYSLRNSGFLERLTQFLSENIGNIFSAKKISDFLKSQRVNISPGQVQNYVSYLANAFIVHRATRYDIVGKRIFEFGEKFYFENLGLRNIIIGYRPGDRAKIFENLVYNQLLYLGYDVKVGTIGDAEIDFVASRDNEKIYIQSALEINDPATMEREYGNLLKIDDNFPKIVVTRDGFDGNTYRGINTLSIREFLTSRQ